MSDMEKKYSIKVKNDSENCGDICVLQTMPNQPDDLLSLAWFHEAAHPGTTVEFDWTIDYGFTWSEQGELRPGVTFGSSQTLETDSACNSCEANGICAEENTEPPKYYAVFGDYKEGDVINISTLENAVELDPEDLGKTLVINEDNSISIE